jgi:hypothetical protein
MNASKCVKHDVAAWIYLHQNKGNAQQFDIKNPYGNNFDVPDAHFDKVYLLGDVHAPKQ